MTETAPVFAQPSPQIRLVPVDRPWAWLAAGWHDLLRARGVSLAYGAAIVAASFLLLIGLWLVDLAYLILPLAAGFLLVAPLLAIGLYETSRRLAAGEPVSLAAALGAWRRNGEQIAYFGLLLALFMLAWIRIASLLIAFHLGDLNPSLAGVVDAVLFSSRSLWLLGVGSLVGAGLAALVFGIGALSIPMLLDRDVNVFTAVATSWTGVRHNWKPMALWAALIVAATAFGFATCFVGLALTVPLVGHASWHAYKEIVA